MVYKRISSLIFLLCSVVVMAQPTGNLGQLELSVTDKYKAKVADASKIENFPSFKDTTTKKMFVSYGITSSPINTKFKIEQLSPARIAKIPVDKLSKGLVRLGYGLYNTPLAELYYNSGRSSTYSFGFSGKHISTQTGVNDILFDNNSMSNNHLGAYLNRFYDDLAWQTDAYGAFNKVSYYGLDRVATGEQIPEAVDPNSNWYRQFGINSSLLATKAKSMGWLRSTGIKYYNLTDNYSSMENNLKVLSNFAIPAEEYFINTDLNLTYFKTEYDSIGKFNQSYLTLQLNPKISAVFKDVLFDFGLNLYYNSSLDSRLDEADGGLFFFPEIKINYPIVKDVLTTYGGVKGSLNHNTVKSIIAENPFIQPGQTLTPTKSLDIFIGMNGILSATTSFNLRGGFINANDYLLYYRDPLYYLDSIDDGVNVLYDDVGIFYVKGELSVNLKNNLQLDLLGDLKSFDPTTNNKVWHQPVFSAQLNALYTLKKKIKFNSKLIYVGPRFAFEQSITSEAEAKLAGYLDVNLGVEYLYNSRLSAFINVNNLLNSQYSYYLGYNTQNINVLFGLAYQF